MKKAMLLLAIMLLNIEWINAQQFEKLFKFDQFNYETKGFKNLPLSDGGFVVCGYMGTPFSGDDALIMRFDASGDTLWTKVISGAGYESFYDVKQATNGDFILSGNTYSFGNGGSDGLLVVTDQFGNVKWVRTFGTASDESISNSVLFSNGDIISAGDALHSGGGTGNLLLVKTDSSGNTLWMKELNIPGADESVTDMMLLPDQQLLLCGDVGVNGWDGLIEKIDSSGNVIWAKSSGGMNADYYTSFCMTDAGNIAVAGYTNSFVSGNYDALISMMDTSGTVLWSAVYGDSQTDIFRSIINTTNGNLIATGYKTDPQLLEANGILMEIDASGIPLWIKNIGGTQTDDFFSVSQLIDGKYLISGYTDSYSKGLYLVSTDSNLLICHGSDDSLIYSLVTISSSNMNVSEQAMGTASVITPSTYSGVTIENICLSSVLIELKNRPFIKIFPNPSSSDISLMSTETIKAVEIFDPNGIRIFEKQDLNTLKLDIDCNMFAPGLYSVRIITDLQTFSERFVLVRN